MENPNTHRRSSEEWFALVTQCRQSGLTDAAWCTQNNIPIGTFYNAVSRLRKKACVIPAPVEKDATLDLTSHKQDVVRIDTQGPEELPSEVIRADGICLNFQET